MKISSEDHLESLRSFIAQGVSECSAGKFSNRHDHLFVSPALDGRPRLLTISAAEDISQEIDDSYDDGTAPGQSCSDFYGYSLNTITQIPDVGTGLSTVYPGLRVFRPSKEVTLFFVETPSEIAVLRCANSYSESDCEFDFDQTLPVPISWQYPLVQAAQAGDSAAIESAIAHGMDLNGADWWGSTPLTAAIAAKHYGIARQLVAANVRADGDALCTCAGHGDVELLKTLIATGASADATRDWHWHHFRGETALMAASNGGHIECVEFLLGQGARVNAQDNCGRTALHFVRNSMTAEALLLAGADRQVECKITLNTEPQTAAEYLLANAKSARSYVNEIGMQRVLASEAAARFIQDWKP